MKSKCLIVVAVPALILVCLFTYAQAIVYWVQLDVTTWADSGGQSIQFYIFINDYKLNRAPDCVSSLTVTAPDNTVFHITDDSWHEFYGCYILWAQATDFNTQTIPSGRYRVKVIDADGGALVAHDAVPARFLDVPVITFPTDGATVADLTPRIDWNLVRGGTHYLLMLYSSSDGIPVYWWRHNEIVTKRTHFDVPKGALQPGRDYQVYVEAWNRKADCDRISATDWVDFSIP